MTRNTESYPIIVPPDVKPEEADDGIVAKAAVNKRLHSVLLVGAAQAVKSLRNDLPHSKS